MLGEYAILGSAPLDESRKQSVRFEVMWGMYLRQFRVPVTGIALMCATVASAAAADAPAHHIRGTIASVSATSLSVETPSGTENVAIDGKTRVAGVVRGAASDITSGTFIGTANVPGPSSARALEVVVFPKSMAGTGEGDYAWDLPAGTGHSAMTNGTVGGGGHSMMTNGTVGGGGGHSMMTNATVSHVSNGGAKTVTLNYKGGTKIVTIPADAPIVRIAPATKSALVKGAHVVVFPAPTGAAKSVIVGENGVVPPM